MEDGKDRKQRSDIKKKAQPEKHTFDLAREGYRVLASFLNRAQDNGASIENAFMAILGPSVMCMQMAQIDPALMLASVMVMTSLSREQIEAGLDDVFKACNGGAFDLAKAEAAIAKLRDGLTQSSPTSSD